MTHTETPEGNGRSAQDNDTAVRAFLRAVAKFRIFYPLAPKPRFGALLVDHKSVRNEMRKIGYARVSAPHQNLDRQLGALRPERCHQIYREKASGKDTKNRPELEKAIDALGKGDVLVLAEWDRATRSMLDGVHIIERIHARGALIKVLDKPHLDLTTPIGRGFIAFLSALAEDERQRITKRANDGRRAAKARGAKFGRKPKLNAHQQQEARRRLANGESARAVGRTFAVHHSTISRLRAS
jgi:DNA invertase Pin-like site-specific DNA recombinase